MSKAKMERNERRNFLKSLAGAGIGTVTTATVFASSTPVNAVLAGYLLFGEYTASNQWSTTAEETHPGLIIDYSIKERKFKQYGVEHTQAFAEKNYQAIEDLVKDSSIVISEVYPEFSLASGTHSFNPYFDTVFKFCQRYDKPVLHLDPQSTPAIITEHFLGLGGGIYGSVKSWKIISDKVSRRDAVKNALKTATGLYFFMSSYFNSMILKAAIYNNKEKIWRQFSDHETFYLDHIVDQRNVELTNRLLMVPDLLDPAIFDHGKYVLTTFGAAHILGIDFYLKHPTARRIKSALYKYSYDLLDNDEIALFVPDKLSWKKQIIKK